MSIEDFTNTLYAQVEKQGYKAKIVSIEHASELQEEIEEKCRLGLLSEEVYREVLTWIDFKIPTISPRAESIIVVAAPQPQVRVTFDWNGNKLHCMIPPIYSRATDDQVKNLLEPHLESKGYHLVKASLPLKLLAVRSGLAQYGRNNISYVQGMGSFHRLTAFYTNFPFLEDNWGELAMMERCEECTACQKFCPTGAIPSDRFLLRAQRCLTFLNEGQDEFPQWLEPSWHHCLVGCLYCQKICPVDKDFLDRIEEGPTFSHQEAGSLLQGWPESKMPQVTIAKLEKLGLMDHFDVLGRNLNVLLKLGSDQAI
jgi:epoxyqueuosine reductase